MTHILGQLFWYALAVHHLVNWISYIDDPEVKLIDCLFFQLKIGGTSFSNIMVWGAMIMGRKFLCRIVISFMSSTWVKFHQGGSHPDCLHILSEGQEAAGQAQYYLWHPYIIFSIWLDHPHICQFVVELLTGLLLATAVWSYWPNIGTKYADV